MGLRVLSSVSWDCASGHSRNKGGWGWVVQPGTGTVIDALMFRATIIDLFDL